MEKKGSSCKVPSLGSLQAAFLSSIATLFNAHGRLVCDTLQDLKKILRNLGPIRVFGSQLKCFQVARRPIETILACVLLTLVSTVWHLNLIIFPSHPISNLRSSHLTQSQVGFFNFNAQTDRVKLWIPAGSVTRENSFWLNSNYPPDVRYQSAIVKVIIFGRIIHCLNFKKGFHKSACLISFMIW